jgi:hypothetical protein
VRSEKHIQRTKRTRRFFFSSTEGKHQQFFFSPHTPLMGDSRLEGGLAWAIALFVVGVFTAIVLLVTGAMLAGFAHRFTTVAIGFVCAGGVLAATWVFGVAVSMAVCYRTGWE